MLVYYIAKQVMYGLILIDVAKYELLKFKGEI